MLTGFNEGGIMYDRYPEQSLKNKTRQKRAVTSIEYEVLPEIILSISLKELLSSSKTKKKKKKKKQHILQKACLHIFITVLLAV